MPCDPGMKSLLVFLSLHLRCSFIDQVADSIERHYCPWHWSTVLSRQDYFVVVLFCLWKLCIVSLIPRLNAHQNKVLPPWNSGEVFGGSISFQQTCWGQYIIVLVLNNCFTDYKGRRTCWRWWTWNKGWNRKEGWWIRWWWRWWWWWYQSWRW